ncbi:hypothetical protein BLOT_016489 [Blomia tropicalis]|nr:hypothetical protein BLOT_016489 [Blomia tropicalis]
MFTLNRLVGKFFHTSLRTDKKKSLFSLRIGHVGQLSADNIKEANEHHIDVKAILISAPTLWRLPLNCIKGYSSKDFMDCTDVEERFKTICVGLKYIGSEVYLTTSLYTNMSFERVLNVRFGSMSLVMLIPSTFSSLMTIELKRSCLVVLEKQFNFSHVFTKKFSFRQYFRLLYRPVIERLLGYLQLLSLRELMMDEFEHITNEGDVESTLSIISQEVTRIKYEKSSSETEEKNTKEMKKKLHGFMISKIT